MFWDTWRMTVALGLECNRAGFSSLLTTDFPKDRRQTASDWEHKWVVFTTAPTSEVPAALVGSKTSSWVPAEDTASGGHLVTENTCVHSKELPGSSSERCRSLCPCTYTPTCSCETRALFHWDPQAVVVSEEPANICFCQGLTGTLSVSHQKTFLDQQLLFVK